MLACLKPGQEDTKTISADGYNSIIAAQCCTSNGQCRRKSDGECVAGDSPNVEPMTYSENVQRCEVLGLVMCSQSCVNTGCLYNNHPVYTNLPCPAPPPPPSPPSPPPPSPTVCTGPVDEFNIVGGDELRWPRQREFLVALQYLTTSRVFCGGTLITSEWVLTAGARPAPCSLSHPLNALAPTQGSHTHSTLSHPHALILSSSSVFALALLSL
eukprot:2239976-Pleurochrysis_carterae.AAC.2